MRYSRRKCRFCGARFVPQAHNAYHQRYCTREACREASHRMSHRRWRRRQRDEGDVDRADILRVQLWRAQHPRYWRRRRGRRLLMDLHIPVYGLGHGRLRLRMLDCRSGALRDLSLAQPLGRQWSVIRIGGALRDFIRVRVERWYHGGHRAEPGHAGRRRRASPQR